MGLSDDFKEMMESQSSDAKLEAVEQLTNYKNIELKTDIPDSIRLALFNNISSVMKDKDLEGTSSILRSILEDYQVYQISKDRQSRKEVVDVLRDMEEEEDETDKIKKLINRR